MSVMPSLRTSPNNDKSPHSETNTTRKHQISMIPSELIHNNPISSIKKSVYQLLVKKYWTFDKHIINNPSFSCILKLQTKILINFIEQITTLIGSFLCFRIIFCTLKSFCNLWMRTALPMIRITAGFETMFPNSFHLS